MREVAVVGDIHGDARRLRSLLLQVEKLNRHVIFLGDYVNGGAETPEVLELLSSRWLAQPGSWTFLAGNHDLALLDYLQGGSFSDFARLGGVTTISAYRPSLVAGVRSGLLQAMPSHHRDFLSSLEPFWETDEYLVSHTGFDVDDPAARDFDSLCRRGDGRVFGLSGPKPLVVCGHYLQKSGRPFVNRHLICLDTGCGTSNGPLTAALLPERSFITA